MQITNYIIFNSLFYGAILMRKEFYFTLFLLNVVKVCLSDTDFCYVDGNEVICDSSHSNKLFTKPRSRYLLYEVNPGEGFNLRRDVYMRMATLVKKLNQEDIFTKWTLVLPPWGPLYHWKSKNIGYQIQIKWSKFFDIPSLSKYIPVIELEDFLTLHGSRIDKVYYLQQYAGGWTDSEWKEQADVRECIEPSPYRKLKPKYYIGWFWNYDHIFAEDVECLSIQGYSSTLKNFLLFSNQSAVMIDRAEVILHDSFGDFEYWTVRRSMVFSKTLISLGDAFRKLHLNSTDRDDKTEVNSDYPRDRVGIGGPYIAVHLRRQDFAIARPTEVPSIKGASKQIIKEMKKLNLTLVFVATDSSHSEFLELQHYIPSAIRFTPSKEVHKDVLDGGVAIIDQWICAHGRFFWGTHESTFSFRIQEEREILGLPVESTFNRLCGDNVTHCKQPAKWIIVNH